MSIDLEGVRVKVRKNIVQDDYSVLVKGKVVARMNRVVLKDVVFKVSASGNARARQERQRNVHAFAEGVFVVDDEVLLTPSWEAVTYNHNLHTEFVTKTDGREVKKASLALFVTGRGALVHGAA